jgi:hypothetical protein
MKSFVRVWGTYPIIGAISCAVFLLSFVHTSFANADGRRVQRTILNTAGCGGGNNCHGTTVNTGARLSAFLGSQRVTDSLIVAPGARIRLTLMVAHNNPAAGVNIAVRTDLTGEVAAGTLSPVDTSLSLRGTGTNITELTQTRRKFKAMGDTAITFSFEWQAPTTTGTYFLRAISNSVNNNNLADAGDLWNWLQPVRLVVAGTVSVQQSTDAAEQFNVSPNPVSEFSTFSWILPVSGGSFATALNEEYTLRLVNAAGVELRSWNGVSDAGRVVVPFDGKDAQGITLSSGQYFAVLQTRKRQFVRTVALVR